MKAISKYNYINKLLTGTILATTLFITSCKKSFLDNRPELNIPEDQSFATPARILAQVNGLYLSAKSGSLFGGRYYIYNDVRGEEFRNRTSNVVTGYSAYQFTNDPSDTYIEGFWSQGYLTINRINKFLADFELSQNQGIVTDAVKKQYIAEAKFIRGWTYYALVQLFAKPYTLDNGQSRGLPLRLTPQIGFGDNKLASSKVADIYTQILKDLNDAEVDLPDTYSSAATRTTRAHKNTAIALKTRVYLAMGDFGKVIVEGNKIVSPTAPFTSPNRVAHALIPEIRNVFGTEPSTVENVFSVPMATTNPPGTQNQLGYYYNAGNIEFYLNQSGAGIYANTTAWPATDARRTTFTSAYSAAWHLLTKWSAAAPYIDWVPVIRYSEVLLNLAEGEAEAGSLTRAHDLVNAVRRRSDAAYVVPVFTDKTVALNNIFLERRIELLGEGFRAQDLQRRLLPFPSIGAGASIPVTDSRYVFPIPTSEKLTNPIVE
ncbi:RagB/SusD family nutrient uptake outer membrane protein [Terrimonas rubra]|uniref:RagB/SusD family nutrient uptake outer membrane protein n=1 Tax=Terrimonas rubra TaxID=1035890 RepID=A0ABW6A1F8_9BACT